MGKGVKLFVSIHFPTNSDILDSVVLVTLGQLALRVLHKSAESKFCEGTIGCCFLDPECPLLRECEGPDCS